VLHVHGIHEKIILGILEFYRVSTIDLCLACVHRAVPVVCFQKKQVVHLGPEYIAFFLEISKSAEELEVFYEQENIYIQKRKNNTKKDANLQITRSIVHDVQPKFLF